ncbi:hypothetical protein HNQ50_004101 [Silvimonas terrae]|uniref:Uncharacterized protein n=1 Tax=Silvimonas terrae TaxID=300266 RepID=A0A840RJQ4_9NEIS|nr:hypothetical protein [Silvimonas terrae]MBB5193347.1 hypothetical protein [Silvimonas terrae]
MHVEQARQSLVPSWSLLEQEQFSGTWQPDSSNNAGTPSGTGTDSSNAPSPSTAVQLSQAGQQAAAASTGQTGSAQNSLVSEVSPELDIFRSMMEQMLGTSITGMQFSGQLAEGAQVGVSSGSAGHHGHGNGGASGNMYAAFGLALNLSGTITTADGRTLGFTASMTMLEASSWSGGTGAPSGHSTGGSPSTSLPSPTPAPSTGSSGSPTSASPSTGSPAGVPSVNIPIPAPTPAPTASAPTPTSSSPAPGSATPAPTPVSPTPAPTPTASTGGQSDWVGSLLKFETDAIHFMLQLNQTLFQQMGDWLAALNGNSTGSGNTIDQSGTGTPSSAGSTSSADQSNSSTDVSGTTTVTITGDAPASTTAAQSPTPSTSLSNTYSSSSKSPSPGAVDVSA